MSVLMGEGLVRSSVREHNREGVRRGADRSVRSGVRMLRLELRAGDPWRPPARWPWLAGLAVAVCLIITGLGLFAVGMTTAEVPAETDTVSVAPGETLSDLAARFAPGSDTGAVVERIKLLNRLDGAAIAPGTPLTVPIRPGPASAGS